jgi:uncharacterized membrane protein
MKQQMFINLLRNQIAALPTTEVEDIIRDQEEFIRDAIASGRDEEAVIAGLGDPRTLGQALVAQFRIEHAQDSQKLIPKIRSTWSAVFAFIALAPLNLFFILVPFSIGMMLLFTFWTLDIAFASTTLAFLSFYAKEVFTTPLEPNVRIAIGLALVGTLSALVASTTVLAWLSKLFLTRTLDYLKWNLKILNQSGEPHREQ